MNSTQNVIVITKFLFHLQVKSSYQSATGYPQGIQVKLDRYIGSTHNHGDCRTI